MTSRASRRARRAVVFPGVAVMIALTLLPGCGEPEPSAPTHPVVLIGVDGLEWAVARPLLRNGRMPHLRALIERGVAGHLDPDREFLSPVIWTSIATGKKKEYHGIEGFLTEVPDGVPVTSRSRRGKALWNIASDFGRDVLCVGWWVTWPAEEIRGRMVAPYSSMGQDRRNWKGNLRVGLEGQTWPAELFDAIWSMVESVNELEAMTARAAPYFEVDPNEASELPALLRSFVKQTLWSVSADETYAEVLARLLEDSDEPPDLTLGYLGAPDVASHRFWCFMEPDAFQYDIDPALAAAFGNTIEWSYQRADQLLGRILAAAPSDANVVVCSDHGFGPFGREEPVATGVTGHHYEGPTGVIVMAGPDIVAADPDLVLGDGPEAGIPRLGWVYDVAPVVLYLLGIPAGRDFEHPDGGPLLGASIAPGTLAARPPEFIESHDVGFRPPAHPTPSSEDDEERLRELLEQTGYLPGSPGYPAVPDETRKVGDRDDDK